MTDYLSRLAARTPGLEPLVVPHLPSRFEPVVPTARIEFDLEASGDIDELRSIPQEQAGRNWLMDNSLSTPKKESPEQTPAAVRPEDDSASISIQASRSSIVRPLSAATLLRQTDENLHPLGVHNVPRVTQAETRNETEAEMYQEAEQPVLTPFPPSRSVVMPTVLEKGFGEDQPSLRVHSPPNEVKPQNSGKRVGLSEDRRSTESELLESPESPILPSWKRDNAPKMAELEDTSESKTSLLQSAIRLPDDLIKMDEQRRSAARRVDDLLETNSDRTQKSHTHPTELIRPRIVQPPEYKPTSDGHMEENATPVIHVNIGRIEVRAAPIGDMKAPRQRKKSPTVGLDEYLRHRDGEGRK